MSGRRLIIGFVLMGIIVPVILFLLLGMTTVSQLLTIAATTFLSWGVGDLFATILERPRLKDRTPGRAFREDWERRAATDESTSSRSSS